TGSGKTLAGFLALIDRLLIEKDSGHLNRGVSCIYISPLKSLSYDVGRSLNRPIHQITEMKELNQPVLQVGVRTGDSSPAYRQKLRNSPPDILVTTPESLSILLTQSVWTEAFRNVSTVVVDEIHAIAGSKRGSDLAISLERLAEVADRDPQRIGLSATCRPVDRIASFLAGSHRTCQVCQTQETGDHKGQPAIELNVESLLKPDESAYRPLVHQRLVKRLDELMGQHDTTVVFTNTRPMTERVTFLMRERLRDSGREDSLIAAHHGSLDLTVRQQVEESLKNGLLKMVVSSTSLELGVDYDSADYVAQVGMPGSVTRCLQRLGRSGHGPGKKRAGVILAGHPCELATSVVTAKATLEGDIEEVRVIENPLDVLCQHLLAMACLDDWESDEAYRLVTQAWPFRSLLRRDFDTCLDYLSGELTSPSGAYEPEQGAPPKWTSPRLWKAKGQFGVRNRRIIRWFRMNAGTIYSEETLLVECDGRRIGQVESIYADRLQAGDRFVLDGRPLEFARCDGNVIHAKNISGEAFSPRWTSERPGLSANLAQRLAVFRDILGRKFLIDPDEAHQWLVYEYQMREPDAHILMELWQRQLAVSVVPRETEVLIETYPNPNGWSYAFHLPLHRSASEALGRAISARIGRLLSRDLELCIDDLGFLIETPNDPLSPEALREMFHVKSLQEDVLEGIDRGELIARRFRRSATTGFMVLRNVEGGKVRVGGQDWVSRRLFPVVRECCPDHPLIREARREALEELLDLPSVDAFLKTQPTIRTRTLKRMSPFAAAWLKPYVEEATDPIQFESPDDALKRLHQRLFAPAGDTNP
ncbi:MAG: hypothetical protein RJA81_954, partial [Planctomycetota bacterium]